MTTQGWYDEPTNPLLPTTEGISVRAVQEAMVLGESKKDVSHKVVAPVPAPLVVDSQLQGMRRLCLALSDFIAFRDSAIQTNVTEVCSPLQLCLRQLFVATRAFYARGPLYTLSDLAKLCPAELSRLLLWMHRASYDPSAAHWFILSAAVDEIRTSVAVLDADVAQALVDAEKVLKASAGQ